MYRGLSLPADLNANQGPLQGCLRAQKINLSATPSDPLFRAFLCSRRARDIDVLRSFRCFREDAHLVVLHFNEAPRDGDEEPAVALPVCDFSDFQFGKQRRVAGQNSKGPVGSGNLQFIDLLVNNRAVRRNDDEIDSPFRHLYVPAAIFCAFCRASSIVPTM